MQADLQNPQGVYQQPSYQLVVDGRDITPTVRARLVQLSLREARSGEADQLDITLDDSDGRMRIPARGAKVTLRLGYTRGGDMAAAEATLLGRRLRGRLGRGHAGVSVPVVAGAAWAVRSRSCWRRTISPARPR